MSHSHTHAPGQTHSHTPSPAMAAAQQQQQQQQQYVPPPPADPKMQALIEADYKPVNLKLGPPNDTQALCVVHELEKCDDCNVDFASTNSLARIFAANPNLLCPPPPQIVQPQRSQAVTKTKEDGNALFKANKLKESISMYTMAISVASQRFPWELNSLMREELSTVLSNRSAAYTAAGDYVGALVDADLVIQLKRPWSKGHFRKAKALVEMGCLEEARDAIRLGLAFEHGNTDGMWRNAPSSSSSRLSTLKGLVPPAKRDALRTLFRASTPADGQRTYPPTNDHKQSWRQWANDKIRRSGTGSGSKDAIERVSLFPGWAARTYHGGEREGKEAAKFSLEIYISGFAASYVPPESATRSQRAFMRLAKAYAALPKLPSSDNQTPTEGARTPKASDSTEDLLKTVRLPPTPSDITEGSELGALEKQFRQAESDSDSGSTSSSDSGPSSSHNMMPPEPGALVAPQVSYISATSHFLGTGDDLALLHSNLMARLQPFWSRALPNRKLRLSLYSRAPHTSEFLPSDDDANDDPMRTPIYVCETTTKGQSGAFEVKIRVPWERICVHPGALHIAFSDANADSDLFVCAELLPPNTNTNPNANASSPMFTSFLSPLEPTAQSVLAIPVTHSEIRLISDIDDTIKLSNILGGARAVFRNVFVKHLEELVIKGMGDWYTSMWSRGVRFHYVSNSPFELLPVINEFIRVSDLPQGSIKLRSYAGRSLFNGFLSAAATRKRDGILDVLNAFKSSRFFLVGDTGEQDLELYAQLAAERHYQILAVFVRDASGLDVRPLDDPTGESIKHRPATFQRSVSYAAGMPLPTSGSANIQSLSPLMEGPIHKNMDFSLDSSSNEFSSRRRPYIDTSTQDYLASALPPASTSSLRPQAQGTSLRFSSDPTAGLSLPSSFFDSGIAQMSSSEDSSPSQSYPLSQNSSMQFPGSISKSELANLPQSERRRLELQERVYRARLLMPSNIPLRIFKEPEECIETDRILDELTASGPSQRRTGR
ncbi:hypothetical protein EW145_g1392 [Phellinidium pouzarii]|uniref:Phosphatidate phosphatase APP1 catalytic domain-containing protein n=1 Tax=Phellinidium pouzarii TaxID=167371 RepID=A0A4S4LEQ0_9AGAM|nr:hypothetical protein EW145_g1392 [Phellinidium pouzarii]